MDMIAARRRVLITQPHPVTLTGGLAHFQTDVAGLMQITGSGNITVCGRNLFNKAKLSTAYQYIDSTGAIIASNYVAGWKTSEYIPVTGQTKITYSGISTPGQAPYCAWYKADKSLHSTFKHATGTNVITVPSGAAYVVFSVIQRDSGTIVDGNTLAVYAGDDRSGYAAYTGETLPAGTARKSLAGINNVFPESGSITVTYWTH